MKENKQRLDRRVAYRLTKDEYNELTKTANFLNCKPSDVMRMAVKSVNIATSELATAN